MLRVIDAHRFGNAGFVLVPRLDFPAQRQFAQWQSVRRVAIDLVRRRENEWRLRANCAGGFKQVQGAIRVNREIGLRIARGPIVGRLRRRVDDSGDVASMFPE